MSIQLKVRFSYHLISKNKDMKKIIIVFALVVSAGAAVYAFDKEKGRKARKEAAKKEISCSKECTKDMGKECTKAEEKACKKESKSCCEKQ